MLEVWLPLLAFMVLAGSWYHVLRLRERATAHARRLCERHGLQLLDDSVALHRLRVGWRRGGLHALREYRFDTSLGGNDRQPATITLLGDRLVGESMPAHADAGNEVPAAAAIRAAHDFPPPPAGIDHGNNVVPISRARRTLH